MALNSGPDIPSRGITSIDAACLSVLTNARTLLSSFEVPNSVRIPVYLAILLVTAAGLYVAALRARRRAAAAPAEVALEVANA